jgi:hypothetical protein
MDDQKKGKQKKRKESGNRWTDGRQRQDLSLDAVTKVRLESLRVFQGGGEIADHRDTSKGISVPWGQSEAIGEKLPKRQWVYGLHPLFIHFVIMTTILTPTY